MKNLKQMLRTNQKAHCKLTTMRMIQEERTLLLPRVLLIPSLWEVFFIKGAIAKDAAAVS